MITLTDNAVAKLLELMESGGPGEQALRISVRLGGCSGFSYGMALDEPSETDTVYQVQGIPVIVDPNSDELVQGSEIDYVDDWTGHGFKISNPNAVSTCGCGTSFRTATDAGNPGSCD